MAGKFFSVVGVVALVALGVGGIAALAVVKQRITLVVHDEQQASATRGPDPLELLRADLTQLREDFGAFTQALGPQLEQLHASLDGASSERAQAAQAALAKLEARSQADGVAFAARLEALSQSLARTQSEQAASLVWLERTFAAVTARASEVEAAAAETPAPLSAAVTPTPSDTPSETAAASVAAPAQPSAQPTSDQPATDPVAAASSDAATPAQTPASEPKRAFLSFSLPSQSFSFAGRQRLALVPSLSRVGFDAKSTLHDFSGVTQKVEGELEVDLANPAAGCSGAVRVDARSLDTGMADRDAGMREQLSVEAHPQLRFTWTGVRDAQVDAAAQKLTAVALGKLAIKGVEREVAFPVRVSVDASKRVAIEGELEVAMKDWGVEPPSQLGMIRVENKLKLWIALRARSLGAAAPAGDSRAK
ncbi:MAG: YceI family protein [Planctomycetes bacterium]|nr:YceI family protein [Planctomycetota bacterium]